MIAFVRQLTQEGYLFQKVLTPNPAYRETFAGGLPAIRFLVLLEENGPRVESAVVKIPRTGSSADNYWRGNMLGAVDIENGRICRVVTGYGEELSEVDAHPDTAASFTDQALVEWAEAMRLCLEAATMFPGIRTQSWDVALTSAGPVLLELNFGGDLNLHQLAHRRGMLSQAFASHLRRCGYKGRLPVEKPASDQG